MKQFLTFKLIALFLFGCSNKHHITQSQPSDASITETYWKLTELMGKKIPSTMQGHKEMYMILKKETDRVQGNSGCNTFAGSYELREPRRITFSQIASTKMACLDFDMNTETVFLNVLSQADSYYIRGDTLQLIRARMAPLAIYQAVYKK